MSRLRHLCVPEVNETMIVPTMAAGVVVESASTLSAAATTGTTMIVPTTPRAHLPARANDRPSIGRRARYGVGRTAAFGEEVSVPKPAQAKGNVAVGAPVEAATQPGIGNRGMGE